MSIEKPAKIDRKYPEASGISPIAEQITQLGREIADKLNPIVGKLESREEFELYYLNTEHSVFFEDEAHETELLHRSLLDLGDKEFGVSRVFYARYDDVYYYKIWGFANPQSELGAWDTTELSIAFDLDSGVLKYRDIEVLGAVNHHFWDIKAFKIDDEIRLRILNMAKAALDLFSNYRLISDHKG